MSSGDLSSPNQEDFWSLKAIGTGNTRKFPNSTLLQSYQKTSITRTSEGFYIPRFPWKVNKPDVPTNLAICKGRSLALMNKLKRSPKLPRLCDEIIKEQEQRGK